MIQSLTVRALAAVVVLLLGLSIAHGERREIVYDIPGGEVSTLPRDLSFAHSGRVGFVLVYVQAPQTPEFGPSFLVSFSVTEGKAVDQIDLKGDFGTGTSARTSPVVSFKVDDITGLVLIYGNDTNNEQKMVALVADDRGRLTRRWSASFGPSSLHRVFWQDAAFNEDASRVYFLHYRESTNVTVLRADDGMRLSDFALPGATAMGFVYSDRARRRVVALSGFTAYAFKQQGDNLIIESQAQLASDSNIGPFAQGISRDGRFVVAYHAFTHVTNKVGFNTYQTYDLDMGTAREFDIPGRLYTAANGPTFHRPTGKLLVPLLAGLIILDGAEPSASERSQRQVDILGLSEDGTINRIVEFRLPERSEGNSQRNLLDFSNNIEPSASGALAFVGVGSGQLFTFDAATGEIVGDDRVDPNNVSSIRLLEGLGKLVFTKRINSIVIIDVATGPVVSGVRVKKKTTTIKGVNFLSGARVRLNGMDLGLASRNPDNPGHEITLNRGKKDFPSGESFTVEVTNPDGLTSKPFTFTR
ncbi:MAG TPA: hypothetical protein VJH03_17165 [Blastocatellia bacterium]|nr:hypothetical protein [Blastocatellia bacterium]